MWEGEGVEFRDGVKGDNGENERLGRFVIVGRGEWEVGMENMG